MFHRIWTSTFPSSEFESPFQDKRKSLSHETQFDFFVYYSHPPRLVSFLLLSRSFLSFTYSLVFSFPSWIDHPITTFPSAPILGISSFPPPTWSQQSCSSLPSFSCHHSSLSRFLAIPLRIVPLTISPLVLVVPPAISQCRRILKSWLNGFIHPTPVIRSSMRKLASYISQLAFLLLL